MIVVTNEKHSLFNSYAAEFEKNYLLEPAGQKHLSLYKKEREEVRRYWAEIKKAKQEGRQITDIILQKLLPYSNTPHNREKNYRISVAPAIIRDLKKWFENKGWQHPDNWDSVANALFDLFYRLIEKGDWDSLVKFENNEQASK